MCEDGDINGRDAPRLLLPPLGDAVDVGRQVGALLKAAGGGANVELDAGACE